MGYFEDALYLSEWSEALRCWYVDRCKVSVLGRAKQTAPPFYSAAVWLEEERFSTQQNKHDTTDDLCASSERSAQASANNNHSTAQQKR